MHMDSDSVIGGEPGNCFEGFVGAGESGMRAYVSAATGFEETIVFFESAFGGIGHFGGPSVGAGLVLNRDWSYAGVAVGDAVGATHSDANFGTGLGDYIEAAFDGIG